jgi:hypothetical protein
LTPAEQAKARLGSGVSKVLKSVAGLELNVVSYEEERAACRSRPKSVESPCPAEPMPSTAVDALPLMHGVHPAPYAQVRQPLADHLVAMNTYNAPS